MLEKLFKTCVATVSDAEHCRQIMNALTAAGIPYRCRTKDVNQRNAFDQRRFGTLGIKPKYITEIFVDKENAELALHVVHTI